MNPDVVMEDKEGVRTLYRLGAVPIGNIEKEVTDNPYESLYEILNDLMKFTANNEWKPIPYKLLDRTYTIQYIINKIEGTVNKVNSIKTNP